MKPFSHFFGRELQGSPEPPEPDSNGELEGDSCEISRFFSKNLEVKPNDFERIQRRSEGSDSLQSPSPGSSDPTSLIREGLKKEGGYTVKVSRQVKLKNLYRFLIAKVFYDEEGMHLDDYLVLWDLHLKILGLLEKDPGFRKKYEESFQTIQTFFEYLGSVRSFPLRFETKNPRTEEIVKKMYPFIPTRNAYFGLRKQLNLRQGYSIYFHCEATPPKHRPLRKIGVGYRDQGTKKPEHDGTPSFSEVQHHFKELEIRTEEEYQGLFRDDPEFNWNRLWRATEEARRSPPEDHEVDF
jgi:hypothetical protein